MESSYLRQIAELKRRSAGAEDKLVETSHKMERLQADLKKLEAELDESRDYANIEMRDRLMAEVSALFGHLIHFAVVLSQVNSSCFATLSLKVRLFVKLKVINEVSSCRLQLGHTQGRTGNPSEANYLCTIQCGQ
jgi:hypothetical protein